MSLVLPPFFHWSPIGARKSITRHGLRPTCPTSTRFSDSTIAVCLGTTPSHAWGLSGAVVGEPGSEWDLWQVNLDGADEVHPLPFFGYRLDEVRVANRIPKSRVWYVATRIAS